MNWTEPALEGVVRLLQERAGLHFAPHRRESVEMGIRRAMTRAGIRDTTRYLALLQDDSGAFDDLLVELTVGETYFFREPAQLAFIRREVVPEVRRRRGDDHVFRAWSAGCASGEEPYSLAILLEEEGLAERASVLATDISRASLAKALAAVYSAWSLRGEGATAAASYLSPRGQRYVLAERIRRRVTFEYLNLALDVYPSFGNGTWGMDLILCRNVLIYFDRETVCAVARRLFASLAPGGWLITASSDPPLGEDAPFAHVVTDAGVFYRHPVEGGVPGAERGAPGAPSQAPGLPPVGPALHSPPRTPRPALDAPRPAPRAPRSPAQRSAPDPLAEAQQAFARGEYHRVAELTRGLEASASAAALRVRALANSAPAEAERCCAESLARHPLATELHYLHAVLLLDQGREEGAIQALRRVLYLDRSLASAEFTLGSILQRRGDLDGARRAYRNAHALSAGRPAAEVVPLSDGEHAGRLAEAAAAQLALVTAVQEM